MKYHIGIDISKREFHVCTTQAGIDAELRSHESSTQKLLRSIPGVGPQTT
ncbi:MAG: hypothetical protein AAB592_00185 [Patescibacteria group bacterium]